MSSPLKIDICAYDAPNEVGGPYVWIQRFPAKMRDMGFDIRVRLFSWQTPELGNAYRVLQEQGIPVQSTIFSDTETNVRWLLQLAEASRPDVFIANHVIPAYYAAKYLKEAGIASIGILRSDDQFYHAIAERFVYNAGPWQVCSVVCVSEHLRLAVERRSTSSPPACRIPSGVPIPPRKTMLPTGTFRIAYVGRIVEEQKQASLLTKALLRATNEVRDVEAVLYGSGPASENVERIIAESGSSAVRYMGELSTAEIQERLLAAHVIVLLSDYEGTPMAVMEGMACGCVPVCLNISSGIPELVEHGVTGLLVEDRHDSFVSAVRVLREDPAFWSRLSENARSRIVDQYSISKCGEDWSDLINTVQKNVAGAKSFICPKKIQLPKTHVGFAHQDWRRPSALGRLLIDMTLKYRRVRILAGRVRRRLLGLPIP